MWMILVEHVLEAAKLVGPFQTKDEADHYAKTHTEKGFVWRILPVEAPKE